MYHLVAAATPDHAALLRLGRVVRSGMGGLLDVCWAQMLWPFAPPPKRTTYPSRFVPKISQLHLHLEVAHTRIATISHGTSRPKAAGVEMCKPH